MSKIFISHASADSEMVNALMDMIQSQFNLTRENFFNTSDEQLTAGGNWIEQIRQAMHESTLIMPIITPSYLESAFCICELGAAWVNVANLLPLIVAPLDYTALDATPYRRWLQTIQLDSEKGLSQLFDAINDRKIGSGANSTRFISRARDFRKDKLLPFIKAMNEREVVTPALVKQLRSDVGRYKEAYELAEVDEKNLREENNKLRQMKDAEEVKQMDYEKMDEWETFMDLVEKVKDALRPLRRIAVSVLYYNRKAGMFDPGFIADEDDNATLNALDSEGMAIWNDGWRMDKGHPYIEEATAALNELQAVIEKYGKSIEKRFREENPGVRFGLDYSPFWEALFIVRITHPQK
ncbi:toll/interleukin-1 receptor domain-containing protein [Paenibacillus oryzisoli]|uniref:TIR domain-containing protein n=1 Tax=Paenibacillus oryzisoli TaxID=1850517 RepID=A0A198AIP0_9BACL|nr:toll/interleukin-1 receptor domain-containing protein [Paenibacillus oryzisoli]OAS21369.1 hypothetical protein A8708_31370 [Paenibacillus oryzisoli]